MSHTIEVNGIYKRFNGVELLRDVNLKVADGETVALMGPSGSGKSVLLKIITGLINPDEGEVIIAGESVTNNRGRVLDRIREHIAMIFQGNALFDSLNVGENVAFALNGIKKIRPDEIARRVREALSMVKLGTIENMDISALSGGMKKRVGIARALIANPKVLLTDDPTAGLDPATAVAITSLLQDIKQTVHCTGIVVTTAMDTACRVADRIAFLDQGSIMAEGTFAELKKSTVNVVRKFIEAMT